MKIPDPRQATGLKLARGLLLPFARAGNPASAAADWIAELLDCLDHTISIEIPVNGTLGCTGCSWKYGDDCDMVNHIPSDDPTEPPVEVAHSGPLPELCPLRLGWRVVMGACEVQP